MRYATIIAAFLGPAALAACEAPASPPPVVAVAASQPPASPVLGQTVTIQPDGTVSRETFTQAAPTGGASPTAEPPQSVPAVPHAQVVLPASCRVAPAGGSGYACER